MAALPAKRRVVAPLPARRPPPKRTAPPKRSSSPRQPTGALVLDTLMTGRLWIGLVFVLLTGIVFFNVSLLQLNRSIARTAEQASAVEAQNARLRTDLARLGSSERIQQVAAQAGLVLPAPGEVRYLRVAPAVDAKRAAERIDNGDVAAAPAAVPPATRPAEPAQPSQQLQAQAPQQAQSLERIDQLGPGQ